MDEEQTNPEEQEIVFPKTSCMRYEKPRHTVREFDAQEFSKEMNQDPFLSMVDYLGCEASKVKFEMNDEVRREAVRHPELVRKVLKLELPMSRRKIVDYWRVSEYPGLLFTVAKKFAEQDFEKAYRLKFLKVNGVETERPGGSTGATYTISRQTFLILQDSKSSK